MNPRQRNFQDLIENSVFSIENPEPKHSKADCRNKRWNVKESPVDRHALHLRIQQQREGEREAESEEQGKYGVEPGIPERDAKHFVFEKTDVVRRSNKDRGTKHGVVAKAVIERCEERIEQENAEPDEPGSGENIACDGFATTCFHLPKVSSLNLTLCRYSSILGCILSCT